MLTQLGLRSVPFTREIPTSHLFQSPPHQELLARLQYIIRHRAFGLITGEVGAGKSTAIRALYDQLDRTRHQFLYIADARLTPAAFYRDVLTQLGVAVPFHGREARRTFERSILDGYQMHGRQPVVVLDEAHLLSGSMLQEVRFLLLCRARGYAERGRQREETERPRGQALGIITELQEMPVVCREDDSGQVLC